MEIQYDENSLTCEEYAALRAAVGWESKTKEQVETALSRTLLNVVARLDGKAVGMARMIGDSAIYWHIQDVIVDPMCQGHGVGKCMIEMLLAHVRKNCVPGTRVNVGLMAAKDKEPFYNKLGFTGRPDEKFGAGMILIMDTE